MPAGLIESNQDTYLASNLAIQSTAANIQVSQDTYLASNLAIQLTGANIQASQDSYLASNIGIQSTAVIYPIIFNVPGTVRQTWVG